jgi:hypothetical protein
VVRGAGCRNYLGYVPGSPQVLHGVDAVKRLVDANHAAFSDFSTTILDQIAEGGQGRDALGDAGHPIRHVGGGCADWAGDEERRLASWGANNPVSRCRPVTKMP